MTTQKTIWRTYMNATSKISKLVISLGVCIVMQACKTSPPTVETPTGEDYIVSEHLTDRIFYKDSSSPIWTSGNVNDPDDENRFVGSVTRYFGGDYLKVELTQLSKSGMDTGIEGGTSLEKASMLDSNYTVSAKLTIDELVKEGSWWYGPKISVGWNDEGHKDGTKGWYENYIVESGSDTPQELHDLLTGDWYKGELVATTTQDGSVYKHYLAPFKSWHQFWSVRQDFRNEGSTNIGKIVKVWLENGLPDKKYDGVKINIETHHPQQMTFTISDVEFDL